MYRSLLDAQTVINRLEALVTEDLDPGSGTSSAVTLDHPGAAHIKPPSAHPHQALGRANR